MHQSRIVAEPKSDWAQDSEIDSSETTDLLFRLDGETFAVPVVAVNEIIDPQPVSLVPNANPLVPGVINVRGAIIPLFDIRSRLGMAPGEATASARMIVFEKTEADATVTTLAFCADAVEQVVERGSARFDPLPELGVSWPAECLAGSYRDNGELVICLNPCTVFCIVPVAGDDTSEEARS